MNASSLGNVHASVHHPFTAALPEWADKFVAEPGGALADAYVRGSVNYLQ
jgi:hypothetical protein